MNGFPVVFSSNRPFPARSIQARLCLAVVEILIRRETAVFPAQSALPENDGFPDNAGNGLPTLAFARRMRSACELKRSSKLCAVLPHSIENYTNLATGDFEAAQLSAWKRPVFPVDRAAEQQRAVFAREGQSAGAMPMGKYAADASPLAPYPGHRACWKLMGVYF